jgi:hypothetical protein
VDDGFDYVISLHDELSASARAQKEALRELKGQFSEVDRAARASTDAFKEVGDELFSASVKAFALVEAVKKLGELGIESVKFAFEAAEFRHNTEIAYAAVQGTAEEGEKTFRQIDALAMQVHLPAEKAHGLARDLMLQGLEDTKAIGAVITADAALIRTGQEQGAEKLKSIVERSLASGHFDIGRGMSGKGGAMSGRALAGLGVHLPELLGDIAKRTGDSLDTVKAKLAQGKIDTAAGIGAITDLIAKGPIGTAARSKFDFGDFTADITNSFRKMVQDVDLKPLEVALEDMSQAVGDVAAHKEGVQGLFQTIVNLTAEAIEDVTEFGVDFEIVFYKIELAAAPVVHVLQEINRLLGATGGMADKFADTQINPQAAHPGLVDASGDVLPGKQLPSVEAPHEVIARSIEDYFSRKAHEVGGMLDLRPHADGGMVQPAQGEVLASVAPGEIILPRGTTQSDVGGGSGGTNVHVDVGGIHFSGHVDSKTVLPLLESQLADIFERAALELGR